MMQIQTVNSEKMEKVQFIIRKPQYLLRILIKNRRFEFHVLVNSSNNNAFFSFLQSKNSTNCSKQNGSVNGKLICGAQMFITPQYKGLVNCHY